ncbi:unnamed protein product [Parnassius apollo]|uniref:(apollo) hypothetical protein n=1 Tax=Parnassius apollo TaxID=110799 RepID=A0A8S3Y8Y1_PARAO|nr:unnamed protein product [Parnassius apollo]
MKRVDKIITLALKNGTTEPLQGCSKDDHISTSLNKSEVSSELNQDQIRAAEGLESLITLSDLGLSHDDRNDMTTPLDTCGGQNKNSHVAAMFLCISKLIPDMRIDHKFLIPGHTHMECDSVHAQIERKKKKTDMSIHLPRDWYNLVRLTSSNITVIIMRNDMFLDFASLYKSPMQLRKVDPSGEKFIWHDVKWFRYSGENESGTIQFKTNIDSPVFKNISFSRRGKANEPFNPQKCYDNPLPISQEKKNKDLLGILHLIDNDCHNFYKKLETNSSTRYVDTDLEEFNDV